MRTSYILPLRHVQTRVRVDIAIGLPGFERQLITRAETVSFGGLAAPVATAGDLLLMKVLAGRPRDVEDARTIVLKQGPALSWSYVLATGRALQEAVGQDLVTPLHALQRPLSPESE